MSDDGRDLIEVRMLPDRVYDVVRCISNAGWGACACADIGFSGTALN